LPESYLYINAVRRLARGKLKTEIAATCQVEFDLADRRKVVGHNEVGITAKLAIECVQFLVGPVALVTGICCGAQTNGSAFLTRAAKKVVTVPRKAKFLFEAPSQVNAIGQRRLVRIGRGISLNAQSYHY
jgi:hypothetical protein